MVITNIEDYGKLGLSINNLLIEVEQHFFRNEFENLYFRINKAINPYTYKKHIDEDSLPDPSLNHILWWAFNAEQALIASLEKLLGDFDKLAECPLARDDCWYERGMSGFQLPPVEISIQHRNELQDWLRFSLKYFEALAAIDPVFRYISYGSDQLKVIQIHLGSNRKYEKQECEQADKAWREIEGFLRKDNLVYRCMALPKQIKAWLMIADAIREINTKTGTVFCKPEYCKRSIPYLNIQEGFHPGFIQGVSNSILLDKDHVGYLVGGENASGKTTFLEMIALQYDIAQRILLSPGRVLAVDPRYKVYWFSMDSDQIHKKGAYHSYFDELFHLMKRVNEEFGSGIALIDEVGTGAAQKYKVKNILKLVDWLIINSWRFVIVSHNLEAINAVKQRNYSGLNFLTTNPDKKYEIIEGTPTQGYGMNTIKEQKVDKESLLSIVRKAKASNLL